MLKIQAVKERHKMKSENYQSSHSLLYCTFSPKITTVKSFLKFLLFKNCAHTMYLYIHNILFLYTKTHRLLHTLFFLVLYLRNLSVSAVWDTCVHCWSLQPHSHSIDNTPWIKNSGRPMEASNRWHWKWWEKERATYSSSYFQSFLIHH